MHSSAKIQSQKKIRTPLRTWWRVWSLLVIPIKWKVLQPRPSSTTAKPCESNQIRRPLKTKIMTAVSGSNCLVLRRIFFFSLGLQPGTIRSRHFCHDLCFQGPPYLIALARLCGSTARPGLEHLPFYRYHQQRPDSPPGTQRCSDLFLTLDFG